MRNTNITRALRAAQLIAKLVNEKGGSGKAYYVGGCVRDKYAALLAGGNGSMEDAKDIDIEIHGVTPETLWSLLHEVGSPAAFGESFGVYSLDGVDLDIAMPRKEHATGRGHKDFAVSVDPFIGAREASRRRDFTVNALMEDILTGEVVDCWGGLDDLAAGILRHVDSESFPEDPLRVLRAARFAAKMNFVVAEETIDLCRGLDLSALSRERIEGEMKKALLKSERPSIFFNTLRAADQLGFWFPEVKALIGVEQDPVHHPEGDVWNHTMDALDRAAALRDKVQNPYAFMLLALCHDFGKTVTTKRSEKDGRIHAIGHETAGMNAVDSLLERVCGEMDVRRYVRNMVPIHMGPNTCAAAHYSSIKATNRMFDKATSPVDLVWFAAADRSSVSSQETSAEDTAFLLDRLHVYEETMARPSVKGQDLIDAGLIPGRRFSELLAYAHKLHLAGVGKEAALKQVLAHPAAKKA